MPRSRYAGAMTLLILVVAVTLSVSAICSLLEATLYSTRVVTLDAAKAEGKHRGAAVQLLRMKRDIATPTSAILILNTIANTAGATFAGMYAADVLGASYVPVFSAVLTLLILLFAEIIPKTYGASSWKTTWPLITWPLVGLVRGLSPLIWFTRKLSKFATGSEATPTVTEDEIRATIRMGADAGELSPSEIQILDSVFHLDETTCKEVMIPRDEVDFFDLDQPASSLSTLWAKTRRTRYPVCRGSLDNAVGVVHAKDLVGVPLSDRLELAALMRPISRVPETISAARLLREMQASRRQMALVVDEFGGTAGLVTMKDVLEEIVGTIRDEDEKVSPEITPTDDGFIVRGNVPLVKINREIGLDLYDPGVVTISGFLVKELGRLLAPGDKVELEGAVAEVIEVRANRATSVRLSMPKRPRRRDEPNEPNEPNESNEPNEPNEPGEA